MKLREQALKKLIKSHRLMHREDVISFIEKNPEGLTVNELSRIAELVNNSRSDTAAYYTDSETLNYIYENLPIINKKNIRVLEPSVGVGNFIQIIIDKYSNVAENLIIDVNDIDEKSIELAKLLNEFRRIPENVQINYITNDFLNYTFDYSYDLVIGNPPFLKMKKNKEMAKRYRDDVTTNMSGFFVQKAIDISSNIVMIMPKYFLNNPDFKITRDRVNQTSIKKIIDFGEKGFKGVLIETIALFLDTTSKPNLTETYSLTKDIRNIVKQSLMTSPEYPYWLLYRNEFFEKVANQMEFGVFKVFRDRQLTNSMITSSGEVPVLKSRNIKRDGSGIINHPGYDAYIPLDEISNYTVAKYFDRGDVYLSPNMTYYPRVIKKPKGVLVNGSVAILEKIKDVDITESHLKFLSGPIFEEFYRIARNYSTRSLNIDANSIYFFGLYK